MTKFFAFGIFFNLFFLTSNFSHAFSSNADVNKGKVIYTFESGKMQCLSELDAEGHVWVQVRSLDNNTTINFNKIEKHKGAPVFVATMFVKNPDAPCASWVNMQEVKIVIDPIKVEKTTLTGKTLYETKKITVLEN